jgi:tetratricopeptide (TPR) repeat protein
VPQTVLTAFLSSTAEDLKVHREAVYERLRPIAFLKCIRMEDFGAVNADGVKACRDGLETADLFVGLIGMRRGWEPDGDTAQRSITEMEHDWASERAKKRRLSRFIHVTPENFPVPGHLFESEDKYKRQKAFRSKIMSELVVSRAGFENAPLLASAVVENLLTQIIRDPKLVQSLHTVGAPVTADVEAAKLLTAADAKGLTQQAEHAGVERLALFELARKISPEQPDNFDQAIKELSRAVDIAIQVAKQGRGGNLDELVRDVLAKVSERTKAGDFDGAAQEADRGFERWECEEERQRNDEDERRARSLQSGIAILEAGLEQDQLRRDAVAAAKRVEKIVTLTHPADGAAQFNALRLRQKEFYSRGRDRGTNVDLLVAIEIAHLTVKIAPNPHQRGTAWINVGNALAILGERESSTDKLEQAVSAFREALNWLTRDRAPLDWAVTQNNLGNALQALGERESGTEKLEQSVAAYREALKERTRERGPFDWAETQNNLGTALQRLGQRQSGTENLEQAITAYREALKVRTREQVPLDWATTQNNLGSALKSLGERERGTDKLKQAVAAYREALKEWTREHAPLSWAITQNNLGTALESLGARESDDARLEEAVAAFRNALEVFQSAQADHYVAMATRNLARAEALLAQRRKS